MVYYKEVLHNYTYFIHVPNHKNMHWPTRSNKTYAAHDGRAECNTIFKFIAPFLYSDWLHFLWHGMKWFIFEWSIEKHKKYQTKHVKGQAMVRHLPLYTHWPLEVGLLPISIKIKGYVNHIIWLWKKFYSYNTCKLTHK